MITTPVFLQAGVVAAEEQDRAAATILVSRSRCPSPAVILTGLSAWPHRYVAKR